VAQWQASGLTSREYAASVGVSRQALLNWKWQLKKRANAALPEEARFVEVVAETSVPGFRLGEEKRGTAFEVVLGNGTALRVPSEFREESLRKLLSVLERR
jgi:hypothetical protein